MERMDLSNETFTDLDLTGSNFVWTDMKGTKFRNCNLTGCIALYSAEYEQYTTCYYIPKGTNLNIYIDKRSDRFMNKELTIPYIPMLHNPNSGAGILRYST
jgi:hypothetical protein